jgi:integrase
LTAVLPSTPGSHKQRREPLLGYTPSWSQARAEQELDNILADVRRGIWKPIVAAPAPVNDENPLFIDFASDWWAAKQLEELAPRGLEHIEWALAHHLLPFFASMRLSAIDARLVDEYRKVALSKKWPASAGSRAGRPRLSARSFNATLTQLAAILATAEEYGLIPANPAVSRRRRARQGKRAAIGSRLEYDQLIALLDAAHELDLNAIQPRNCNLGRKALLATLFLGGLRVSEATHLERRHIDWVRGVVRVTDSKTPAGFRDVPMHSMLRDIMAEWWERHPDPSMRALLFPSANGTARDRNNVRNRILAPARELADELLAKRNQAPLPEKLATHSGRRTAITWWAEAGYDPRTIMAWVGHEDAAFTVRVYQGARNRPTDHRIVAAMAEVPMGAERSA